MKKISILLLVILSSYCFAQQDSIDINKVNSESMRSLDIQDKEANIIPLGDILRFTLSDKSSGAAKITINGEEKEVVFTSGIGDYKMQADGLYFIKQGKQQALYHYNSTIRNSKHLPLWLSLIPPLLAILLALLFKEVLVSLFVGIWAGVFIAFGCQFTSITTYFKSLMTAMDTYVIGALADADHLSVIVFSMLIGAMVALISKNGGMHGIVKSLGRFANNRKSTQKTTWLLGILIFFDDYANTLIVGNTMRSVTDSYRISREKLAYIVDSTAAPVAAIAFITTWIGAELGYIGDSMALLGLEQTQTPYALFISSLKYSFYPILTLAFIYFIISQGKDYGPMYKAEQRAILTGQVSPAQTASEDEPNMEDLSPVDGAKHIWWYAAIPIFTVIGVTILGLLITGFDSAAAEYNTSGAWGETWRTMEASSFFTKLGTLIGLSNSYAALIWSSFSGLLVALIITLGTGSMKLIDAIHWLTTGFKTMLPAILVLILAWSLASVTDVLHTSDYLSNLFSDKINPYFLPAIIFILAAFIAFSTGSSWSTMAILYPIAIPTAYAVCLSSGLDPAISHEILLCTIATVLAASVLGDHCSPISDTTILSSLASDCNHIDHVRTQLPYALTVGFVSIIGITIAILLGGGWLICGILILTCLIALYLWVKYFGKSLSEPEHEYTSA